MGKVKKKIDIGVTEIILISIIILHTFLLLKLSFFPYPELFVYPYLAEHGFLPYKNILDQHLPSVLMTPFNLYDLGLRTILSARYFLTGTVILSQIFIFLIADKLFKSKKRAIFANILYFLAQPLFEGTTLWLDTFLVPLLLAASYFSFRFLEKETKSDLIFASLFLGFALFIKQVMLPLVIAVAAYLYYKSKDIRKILQFLFFAFLPLAASVFWIYSEGIFSDFLYWTITFNFDVYAKMGRKLPSLSQLARVLVFWAPAFYWLYLQIRRKEILIFGIFMIFSMAAAVSRFEFVHLQLSLPFVALLITGFLLKAEKKIKYAILALPLLVLGVWLGKFYREQNFGFDYFFDSQTREVAQRVSRLTDTNEKIFVLGAQPTIYFLSDRLPAGEIFTVNLPWNMSVAEEAILKRLKEDKPKVVVRDTSASIDQIKVIDFTKLLNAFIDKYYVKHESVGSTEILVLR